MSRSPSTPSRALRSELTCPKVVEKEFLAQGLLPSVHYAKWKTDAI